MAAELKATVHEAVGTIHSWEPVIQYFQLMRWTELDLLRSPSFTSRQANSSVKLLMLEIFFKLNKLERSSITHIC
jgi:hypothetical protein